MSPILEYFYGTKRFRSSYNSPKPRKLKLLPVQGTQKDSCNGNAEHLRRKSAPNLKWRTTICKSRKGNNESALKTTHSCLFRHRPIRPAPHLDDVSKNELLMYRLKFPAHARVVANSEAETRNCWLPSCRSLGHKGVNDLNRTHNAAVELSKIFRRNP